jgi:hypothetical protein
MNAVNFPKNGGKKSMAGRSGRGATWNPFPPRLNLVPKLKIHGAMYQFPIRLRDTVLNFAHR